MIMRAAAVWRLTELVVADEVTRPVREWAQRRGGRLAYLVTCRRCVSMWAAFAVLMAPRWMSRVLALSAVTVFADEYRGARAAERLRMRMAAAGGTVRRQSETG